MSASGRAKELLLALLERAEAEREEELARLAAEDPALGERLRALLAAHARADLVLEPPSGVRAALEEAVQPDVVGDYRIDALLGEGGFGRVYRAEQLRPVRRRVALKLLKPGMGSRRVIARFEAERRLLSRMDHPHVARVLDAGESADGRPFVAMELVEGPPITRYAAERRLGPRARVELVRLTALAIQHAHAKGVLHRDIKPSNVLVVDIDGAPQPRVIDFGIAKALDEEQAAAALTAEGHLVGTPAYMSPEQLRGPGRGGDVDTRSDVWALGVLLYELVVGRPPFEPTGTQLPALLAFHERVLREDPVPPSAALRRAPAASGPAQALPRELDWIVLRCLEKDPERRYASAAELAADLERFLADLPVEAAPPSRTYRLRKLVRRHRAVTLVGALGLLALLLGVVGTSLALVRAARLNADLDGALARVKAEAAEARRQAEVTEAVSRFLTRDVLAAVRPEQGPTARSTTMLEVLERSARELERAVEPGGRFAGLPRVEAGLRYAIGESFASLGEELAALPHAERAHALLSAEHGPDHPDVLRAALTLARTRVGLRQDEQAEASLRDLGPRLDAALGPADEESVLARELLGRLLLVSGRAAEARAVFAAAHEAVRARAGADDAQSVSLLFSLALATEQSGDLEAAGPLHEEAAERSTRILGPDAPNTLAARSNWGMWLVHAGRVAEGRAILEDALARQRVVLGPQHSDVVAVLHVLAQLAEQAGEGELALERYEEALEATEATRGREHPTATRILTRMAWLADGRGDAARAEALFRDAYERARDARQDDPAVTGYLANLGSCYLRHRRLEEAEPLLFEASRRMDVERGLHDVESVRAFDRLALLAAARGEVDRALALHAQALERASELELAHPARRGIHAEVINLLLDAGRREEAHAAALGYHDELVRGAAPLERLIELEVTLESLCRALGRTEEAARWLESVGARRAAGGAAGAGGAGGAGG